MDNPKFDTPRNLSNTEGVPWVNVINILRAHFSYESELSSFSLVTFGFLNFGAKILYKKRAHKT